MTRQRITVLLFFPILIVGLAAALILYNRQDFAGDRTAAPDSYMLDIQYMTGADLHTLELREGAALAIRFQTAKGSLHMEIRAPDGDVLYSGNGKGATDFTVNIPKDGAYSVRVEARRAKGKIHIQLKEKTK